MQKLIVTIFLLLAFGSMAQNKQNLIDSMGRKQGAWVKKDNEGRLLYQATFKDDKPVGEMKRFHPNGVVKAILTFAEGSSESDAQLFDEKGKLVAQGKYTDQKKTGEWKYFSDSKVVGIESYRDGQKQGVCKRFYKTGELLEESNWANNQIYGVYRSYFQDGKVFMQCFYLAGKRDGELKIWFPNGNIELNAFYTNDSRDKEWRYFDESGKPRFTLKFDSGRLLNPEVQDSIDKAEADIYKPHQIPDPEKFVQNPEEYMLLMQNKRP